MESNEERAEQLRIAVLRNLSQKKRFGVKKRDVRAAICKKTGEFRESPYIHSINTFEQYLECCYKYAEWLLVKHPEARKIKYAHEKGYDTEYIQTLIDKKLSASTIGRATAALAKLYGCTANDIHPNRPIRHEWDINRSREYTLEALERDKCKYPDMVNICLATGVRRCELMRLKPKCFIEKVGKMICHLDGKDQNTKGGKTRDIEILDENVPVVKEILAKYNQDDIMFPEVPQHLDVHAIRAIYAGNFYNSIARKLEDIPSDERVMLKHPKRDFSRPGKLRTSVPAILTKRNGKKYDRSAMVRVSESLGHNRWDVISGHYLRFCKPM